MLIPTVILCTLSPCVCLLMDGYVAPLLDKQEAPLVAIVDTSKIATQLVESLEEPINLLIDEGCKDRENRIQKQLLEFEKKIEQKLNFLENNACGNTEILNRTVTSLEKEIEDMKTPVAMTSCSSVGTVEKGDIIRFPDIATIYGISDNTKNSFIQTGKFTCEKAGLYLVTVSVMSLSYNACFNIKRDGQLLRNVQVVPHSSSSNNFHTGTGSVVVMLDVGETVYSNVIETMTFHHENRYSCMTITKIN